MESNGASGTRQRNGKKRSRANDTGPPETNAPGTAAAQEWVDVSRSGEPRPPSPSSESAQAVTARACENCRRRKLKCSRTDPCVHCVAKSIACIYDDDKKRGPRPGYIEELYRRMETLENMVLGQALLLNSTEKVGTGFWDTVDNEKRRLSAVGCQARQADGDPSLSGFQKADDFINAGHQGTLRPHSLPADDILRQICHAYYRQVDPWLPILHRRILFPALLSTRTLEDPMMPVLQAILAVSAPIMDGSYISLRKYYYDCCTYVLPQLLASVTMERLQAAVILEFAMFSNGDIVDYWGLVTQLGQITLQNGLNVEDEYLTQSHKDYRRLMKFADGGVTWIQREGTRRLFWTIFLMDQFASILSGMPPNIPSSAIMRKLPSEGQNFMDDQAVQVRDFVPAALALSRQVPTDPDIGGFAFMIEATEILGEVSSFVTRMTRSELQVQDVMKLLHDLSSLDLILESWKSRLPARYQRASYDENGYMDHNVTLAHLTHNTSIIILYQVLRLLVFKEGQADHSQSSWRRQVRFIKQAAKEVAKISTKFVLQRKFMLSPQFLYCQFTAARALLAYSTWFSESVDEDFEILHKSLADSSCKAAEAGQYNETMSSDRKIDDFASKLLRRLDIDMQSSQNINLSLSCIQLLTTPMQENFGRGSETSPTSFTSAQDSRHDDAIYNSVRSNELQKVNLAFTHSAPENSAFVHDLNVAEEGINFLDPTDTGQLFRDRIFNWADYENFVMTNDPC